MVINTGLIRKSVFVGIGLLALGLPLLGHYSQSDADYIFTAGRGNCAVIREEKKLSLPNLGARKTGDAAGKLVRIITPTSEGGAWVGVGYNIGGPYVLSAEHVVSHAANGNPIYVRQNGEQHEARRVSYDKQADIALLVVDGLNTGSDITTLRSGTVEPNEAVTLATMGAKDLFYKQGSMKLHQTVADNSLTADNIATLAQDAANRAVPGMSGSPLLDSSGRLVGVALGYVSVGGETKDFFANPKKVRNFLSAYCSKPES